MRAIGQRNFPFQHPTFGRKSKPKADFHWKDTVYYLWWAYLKRNEAYLETCEANGKKGLVKLYKDFGDVRGASFKEWWGVDGRGASLFANPRVQTTVDIVDAKEAKDLEELGGGFLVYVPDNLPKQHITKRFRFLLTQRAGVKRGEQYARVSKAKYQYKGSTNLNGLKVALEIYDLKKANPKMKMYEIGLKGLKNLSGDRNLDYDKKRSIEALVARYLRQAKKAIENVGKGVFP